MANAVLIQNPESIYDDRPGIAYHFPKQYLRRLEECVGDWVIFYEGKKGALGYVAVQRVSKITPDAKQPGHYFAWLDPETLWQFERVVPRNNQFGRAYEPSLRESDTGRAMSGGYAVSAVRSVPFDAFTDIVTAGLKPLEGPNAIERAPGVADGQVSFEGAPLKDIRETVLQSRLARDASFARIVKAAYDGRCAISGLDLRNGGGRAEVQAAHIRPVKHKGPDIVQNGLALSGTVHWMFDRGLITVGENYEIIVADNKVPRDVQARLISSQRRLHLPANTRDYPHQDFLRFHRENVYGAVA